MEICARFILVLSSVLIVVSCATNLDSETTFVIRSKCWEEQCEDKLPTITHSYNNLVVMRSKQPLFTDKLEHLHAVRLFYQHYVDEFDFIFVVNNLSVPEFRASEMRVWGKAFGVSNSVSGIGKQRFADGARYGAPNRLKTVLALSARETILSGPSLHELMHTWITDVVIPTTVAGHWGFNSANGQLGGFDLAKLRHLGDGYYTAGRFGTNANFGNSIPYSPIELYLAGWIPSSEVPDLLVAMNPAWLQVRGKVLTDGNENPIFSATGFETWSVERIIEQIGERVPSHELAQKEFQAAVILLDDEVHPATSEDIRTLRDHIDLFAMKRDLREKPVLARSVNFWTATGGRASITMDTLEVHKINGDGENGVSTTLKKDVREYIAQN